MGATTLDIISQGQKCHKKPFPLVYHQSHKEKSVKGGHRPQRLPLILFFVGNHAGGENGCPSVPLLPPVLHCPFRRKGHIHTHFIVNSVNYENGHKLQWSKHDLKENTVQEVRKALQANIEAIQRATKLLEKQSDTLTSVMKQKLRELEESKNSFFRYEGLKLYLFWGGMVCNILVFLMLASSMFGR